MRIVVLVLAVALAPGLDAQPCDGPAQLAAAAPLFADVTAGAPEARRTAEVYACVLAGLDSEAQLRAALVLRDTLIARVGPLVERWQARAEAAPSGEPDTVFASFFDQAEALAVRPVGAEDYLFGLTYAPFPPAVRALASPALSLHLDALDAEGGTVGGEYPYSNLDAELALLAAGEALRDSFPESPFVAAGQAAFARALLALASLHPATDPDGFGGWYAGVATSDPYPWDGDRGALERFVAERPGSRFHAPLAAILADPPEAATEGDLDVLVVSRDASREAAEVRALDWLGGGVDVVGVLPEGEHFAVVYRYAPAGDARLDAWEERARSLGLAPERVTVDAANPWGF